MKLKIYLFLNDIHSVSDVGQDIVITFDRFVDKIIHCLTKSVIVIVD